METINLTDDNEYYNIYDLTSFTVGESIVIHNNSFNELFVSRQSEKPTKGQGQPIAQRKSTIVVGESSVPVWVGGSKGSVIVQSTVDSILQTGVMDLPADVWTSKNPKTRRLQVDSQETGFTEGREFRINYPLSISTSSRRVLKFSSPIDFILLLQVLTSDSEGIIFRAYRSNQGVESGSFNTPVPIYKENGTSKAPPYTNQVSVNTGGDFTPNLGQEAVETIRVRVSGATAQASTIGGDVSRQRGLPAGDYYLVLTNFTEVGTASGVYVLDWEEKP